MKISAAQKNIVHILKGPKVTEKSGIKSESQNLYTFEVFKNATKPEIAAAIKEAYKVTPIKINIVNLPAKQVFRRGKTGTKSGIKKALVFLKKGDKIAYI
jgi:large subunit ribosomal protein L23